ncbi:MAG: hypothetical protein PHF50_01325 [Patescibacteria group bacterium]|nr:hypothetical protein [Patescibacteria group bacterium]
MENTNCQKSPAKKSIFNFRNANKALLLAIIILGVYYVAGTNDLAIKGFALSDLKVQKNKLVDANNKLELNALSLSSYSNIKEKVSGLKMVSAGEVSYLTAGVEMVAKK